MNYQRCPNNDHLCLLTSFAMVLDVPAEILLEQIGDQWKTLAFPDLPVPSCWRGIHIQELILIALRLGYAVTPVELMPQTTPPQAINPKTRVAYQNIVVFHGADESTNWDIFRNVVMTCRGVLVGIKTRPPTRFQCGHAVAFEKGVIFDPSSEVYMYSVQQCEARRFYANYAWRFDRIEVLNE
jgi:hypothetical protein